MIALSDKNFTSRIKPLFSFYPIECVDCEFMLRIDLARQNFDSSAIYAACTLTKGIFFDVHIKYGPMKDFVKAMVQDGCDF